MSETSLHPLNATRPLEHAKSLEVFAKDVQTAITRFFPSNQKPYSRVAVAVVLWEEDDSQCRQESLNLKRTFEDVYNYTCQEFYIPTEEVDENGNRKRMSDRASARALRRFLGTFCDNFDEEGGLLIFYYHGHGSRLGEDEIFHLSSKAKGAARIDWGVVKTFFGTVDADTLYLLDCCYAATAAIEGNNELLAACSWDKDTWIKAAYNFSAAVNSELKKLQGRSISVAMLHGLLVKERRRNLKMRTPVYCKLTDEDHGSIILAPLKDPKVVPRPSFGDGKAFGPDDPRGLVTVRLERDIGPPDLAQRKKWLSSHIPSYISAVDVTAEGLWKGNSSLLLVALPVPVWSLLRDDPGYSFVDYVYSSNLLIEPSALPDRSVAGPATQRE